MNADEQEIRALVSQWMRATREGDTAAVLDLMTADVLFLTAGQEPFGKAKFEAMAKAQARDGMTIAGESDVLDVQVMGDWACIVNKLRVSATKPGAPMVVRAGHTLTLLRKDGGKWRIARDANLLVPVGTGGD